MPCHPHAFACTLLLISPPPPTAESPSTAHAHTGRAALPSGSCSPAAAGGLRGNGRKAVSRRTTKSAMAGEGKGVGLKGLKVLKKSRLNQIGRRRVCFFERVPVTLRLPKGSQTRNTAKSLTE
ncbi:hypothetical protein chiPu_0028540 [Chiloscyllium punctatum]|uniref:Secreted protein n=1 Tax=Chiloscyllium punctatum TaxID=137246 RepID=A0A401TP17_CHIPU|nr:hypothetical protein [Chiloscyllium punctatum]